MSANGQLTATELVPVQGDIRLSPGTAADWKAMVAACQADTGITLTITAPYGGYRDLQAQAAVHANPGKYGSTAEPGGSSHGTGQAVDIYNWSAASKWLNQNASKYGFKRTITGESWHYQHGSSSPVNGSGFNILDPFGVASGAGQLAGNVNQLLASVTNPGNWKRVAVMTAGAVFLIIALIVLVSGTNTAQVAIQTGKNAVKSTVKDAATAAIAIPK